MNQFVCAQRRSFNLVLSSLIFALLALTLGGCANNSNNTSSGGSSGSTVADRTASGKKLRVGFSQTENDGPWRIAETKSMSDEAAKRGIEIKITDARGQTAQQINDVEDLITQGVDAIFLAPREAEGYSAVLDQAKEANIPVILIDREVNGKAGEDYVAFIGSDFIEEGRRAAEWLAQQTNGKAGIVELRGTANASVTIDRGKGFRTELAKHPGMRIIAEQVAEFNRATGQKVMENIIQAQGANISAVYTHNDEMALGAIQALKAAGRKPGQDVIVVSVDGQKSALEAIVRGELGATVECNPRFGPIAFDTLEKYLRKEQLQPKIIMQDRFFDRSNAAQFVGEAY